MQVAEPGAFGEFCFTSEGGEDVEAVEIPRERDTCGAEGGGEDVDIANSITEGPAPIQSASGPTEGGGDAGPAFVEVELGSTPGSVASGAWDSAIIAEEDDEGIVGVGSGLDGVEDFANSPIHGGNHGGIGATLFVFERTVESEICFCGLKGRMWCVEGEVEEVGFIQGRVIDEGDCMFCEEVGGVAFFTKWFVVLMPVELLFTFVSEVVDRSVVVTHEVREAVGERELGFVGMTKVPLANDTAPVVAGGCEEFRKGGFFGRQPVFRPWWNDGAHHAEAEGPASGEESGAGGGAHRAGPEVGELNTAFDKTVEVGREGGLAIVEAGVGIAEVIGDDEDDIGFGPESGHAG